MKPVALNALNNKSNYIATSSLSTNTCTCIDCGFCLVCIAFAPIVGIFLSTSTYYFTTSSQS